MFYNGAASTSKSVTGSSSNKNSPVYNAENSSSAVAVEPRRMELSLNPEDGSLQTAPLFQVLLAATDALYSDLYNMSEGELDVITTSAAAAPALQQGEEANADDEDPVESATVLRKKERMSNLSFAQRRHELAWRLASNGKSLQHVAALTAVAACTDLGQAVQVSTAALQHTRTAWVQADEAQDALFFFHARLFPARAAPHDIYGASDLLLKGRWYDLPRDMMLLTDRYDNSVESTWSKAETDQRWQMTVRNKLLRGEVGWLRQKRLLEQQNPECLEAPLESATLWKVSLKGGIVRFTVGAPKITHVASNNHYNNKTGPQSTAAASSIKKQYPIEAILTVLPSKHQAWTLLSVTVDVHAKTGEFNHQLETSNRQRYDLHRLAATAMNREESRSIQEHAAAELSKGSSAIVNLDAAPDALPESNEGELPPSRPLNALFHVTHTFLTAWMLEILSAQAQALRRGVWAAAESNSATVTPVRFVDCSDGCMSISFWKVDDSYGPPAMGNLRFVNGDGCKTISKDKENGSLGKHGNGASAGTNASNSQLRLSIRTDSTSGICVSISGGEHMMNATGQRREMIQSTVKDLLDAASNPFALSASDALLAATKLCAEFKCRAVVEALQPRTDRHGAKAAIPPWIQLSVENGSIAIAAKIHYHGVADEAPGRYKPFLFHLTCDARTGSFVATFPRCMQLLRRLVGNESQASEAVTLRIASLPVNRRKAAGSTSTGRAVRESFDSLIRSMNLVGQSTGVGGKWDNIDEKSSLLRERAIGIACRDVKSALVQCIGMVALYGLAPLSLGVAVGLNALSDIAGASMESIEGMRLLKAPPVSILMSLEQMEATVIKSNDANVKLAFIEQSLFSIACALSETSGVSLVPLYINVKLESPTAFPERTSCELGSFTTNPSSGDLGDRSAKRLKHEMNGHQDGAEAHEKCSDLMDEVRHFSELIMTTLNEAYH